MEKTLHNRIVYGFISLLIVSLLGFSQTYLIEFPNFKSFTTAHHFHGLMALLWILLLIVQLFFDSSQKV